MKMELDSLGQLCRVFEGLSAEKKDYILNTAKYLLALQENDSSYIHGDNPIQPNKKPEMCKR